MLKLKIASLSYFFVALITAFCLFFLKADVNLLLVGFYGETSNVIAILATVLVPLFFMLFILFFESQKKVIPIICALVITAVYVSRITASIKNMAYLKSQENLPTAKFFFYTALIIIAGAIAVSFLMLALSDSIKTIGTTAMKVSSIIGIVVFSLFFLAFFLAVFIVGDERSMSNFFAVLSVVFLMDFVNCLFMLLSVSGLRRILYYRNKNE